MSCIFDTNDIIQVDLHKKMSNVMKANVIEEFLSHFAKSTTIEGEQQNLSFALFFWTFECDLTEKKSKQ